MFGVVDDGAHDDAIAIVALVDAQRRVRDGPLHLVRDMPGHGRELHRLLFVGGQRLGRAGRRKVRVERVRSIEMRDEESPRAIDGCLAEMRAEDRCLAKAVTLDRQRAEGGRAVVLIDIFRHALRGIAQPVALRRHGLALQRSQEAVLNHQQRGERDHDHRHEPEDGPSKNASHVVATVWSHYRHAVIKRN